MTIRWISVRVSIWITFVIRCAKRSGSFESVLMSRRVHREIQKRGGAFRVLDAVGELTLNGDRLVVLGHLVEHQVCVDAAGRHDDDLGVVLEVEECQPLPLALDPPGAILDDVFGRLRLEITDVQHGLIPGSDRKTP